MARNWIQRAAVVGIGIAGLAASGLAIASAAGTDDPRPKPDDIVPFEIRNSSDTLVQTSEVSDEDRVLAARALALYEPLAGLLDRGTLEIHDFASWRTELSPPRYTQRRLGIVVSVLFSQPTDLPTIVPGLVNVPENPDAPEQPAAKVDSDGVPVAGPQPADQLRNVQAALIFVLLPELRVHAVVPIDSDSASLTPTPGARIQSPK